MQTTKPGGTREQVAVGAWLDFTAHFHGRMIGTVDVAPSLVTYFDTWAAAGAAWANVSCTLVHWIVR